MPPFLKACRPPEGVANPWNECEEITSLLYDSILAVNGRTTAAVLASQAEAIVDR